MNIGVSPGKAAAPLVGVVGFPLDTTRWHALGRTGAAPNDSTTAITTGGQLCAVPFWLGRDSVLAELAMEVMTLEAAKVMRMAIYDSNALMQPTKLIVAAPEFSLATTGIKIGAAVAQLAANKLYYAVSWTDAANVARMRGHTDTDGLGRLLYGRSAVNSATIISYYSANLAYNANLPDPFPALTSLQNGDVRTVFARFSA